MTKESLPSAKTVTALYTFFTLATMLCIAAAFTGCSHNMGANRAQTATSPSIGKSATAPLPDSPKLPENDTTAFYGVATGDTEKEAKKRAVSDLNRRVWSHFLNRAESDIKKREVYRYLPTDRLYGATRLLEKIPVSKYSVVKFYGLGEGRTASIVKIGRKEMAKPLKKSVLSRLVSIEERWHRSAGESLIDRYLLAKESLNRMRLLLPEYLLTDYIDPFSAPVKKRVEKGLPYFEKTARRLKRRMKFCIEPVSSPAMKRFTDAVAETIAKEKLLYVEEKEKNKDTLCITLDGKLTHRREEQKHIFEATLKLLLHKPYRKPIAIERYSVRGISAQSGSKALQKAAEAFEKELQKRFLKNI